MLILYDVILIYISYIITNDVIIKVFGEKVYSLNIVFSIYYIGRFLTVRYTVYRNNILMYIIYIISYIITNDVIIKDFWRKSIQLKKILILKKY